MRGNLEEEKSEWGPRPVSPLGDDDEVPSPHARSTEKPEWRPVSPPRPVSPLGHEVEMREIQTPSPQGESPPERQRESSTRNLLDEAAFIADAKHDLHVTEDDIHEARSIAAQYTLAEVKLLMQDVYKVHKHDPNFRLSILNRIEEFLGNESVFEHPDEHQGLIQAMKLLSALITNNSPYAEVRAVVDNRDDPETPCSTLRSWTIGIVLAALLAFTNQLFSISLPPMLILASVAQLVAYPLGRLWHVLLPDIGVTLFGTRHSLNPGPFNKKEHMLIAIMASVAFTPPYTGHILWMQYLPDYFNQPFAAQFSYQILVALSTGFIGYGIAGLCRRFLVYPSYCIWPTTLATIALNSALHRDTTNPPVRGPGRSKWRLSRRQLFGTAFPAMASYYFLPGFLFTSLSNFSWMTWIAPLNRDLNALTGFNNGLGLNPWPTFDWSVLLWDGADPLVVPWFSTLSKFLGALASMCVILGLWYGNAYGAGYLPINSNLVYDNQAKMYAGFWVLDEERLFFSQEGYETYSPPYLSAGAIVLYMSFFALYAAAMTYAILYYRAEIARGFRSLWNSMRRREDTDALPVVDVHNRLMRRYAEVPEWWYALLLIPALALGLAAMAAYDTHTSPGVVFYGLALALIFIVPVGLIKATMGIEVILNVLAELAGGAMVPGNAISMNYFKMYGYVTCAHAVRFTSGLKLGHYTKIPPRQTFAAQTMATLVAVFVSVGTLNYQMNEMPGVCTPEAPLKLLCGAIRSHYISSIFWGTIGPRKIWGPGGIYTETLVGFPIGVAAVVLVYVLQRRGGRGFGWLRTCNPVAMIYGGISWAPYNMSYIWPAVPVAWLSWVFLKGRFLGFWSKYNYTLSAAFSTGIAVSSIIIYFALQWRDVDVIWWGNTVSSSGCEADPCVLHRLGDFETFGPAVGEFH